MPSITDRESKQMIKQNWNDFVSLIMQNLKSLHSKHSIVSAEIKKLELIKKILVDAQKDIDFLILHKGSFLLLDRSLEQKFTILEAFKKINNLENPVAVRTYKEILESEKIKNIDETISKLSESNDNYKFLIDSIDSLINGSVYNKNLVDELYNMNKPNNISLNLLYVYMILEKASNVDKRKKQIKTIEEEKEVEKKEDIAKEELDESLPSLDETKNDFGKFKEQYDKIIEENNTLLNKYYTLLNSSSKTERNYYEQCADVPENEPLIFDLLGIKEDNGETYAKIAAVRLFKSKKEIEKTIQDIISMNHSNKDDIELFGEMVEEFKLMCDKLGEFDSKIEKLNKKVKVQKDSKVFFLTNENNDTLIPKAIIEKEYRSSLLKLLRKAENGAVQQKKGNEIRCLENMNFERNIFSVKNDRITLSFIKLNSNSNLTNDCDILILTASLSPKTIHEDTNKILKKYGEKVIKQMNDIEKGNAEELKLQEIIRNKVMASDEIIEDDMEVEEGEVDEKGLK